MTSFEIEECCQGVDRERERRHTSFSRLLTHVKYSCCLTVFPAQISPVVFSTSPSTWYESRRDNFSYAATGQHRFGSLDSSHFALMMALKRKALGDANMQSSKRSTPAPSTPISLDSDEDFSGSDIASQEASGSEAEHIQRARKKLDFSSFNVSVKSAKQNSIFGEKDFSSLPLKPDHENRPLWVDPSVMAGSKKGPKITLESFSPLAAQATDLLTTVAEPQSRPTY